MTDSITQSADALDWAKIAEELADPFDPADVDFRPQGTPTANGNVQVLAYIDARTVQDRLDSVVGIQNWTYDWTPVGIDNKGEIVSVKATLTIHGISKSDVGTASNFEGDKGAVSGGLKRAAVQWGIGRYLYSLPTSWQKLDEYKRISPAVIATLRKSLPRPRGYTAPEPALPEPTPIRRPAPSAPKPEPMVVPVDPTPKQWSALKARIFKAKLATTVEQFEKLMEQTGGSYEDTLAMVEAHEKNDPHNIPALDGQRRNH